MKNVNLNLNTIHYTLFSIILLFLMIGGVDATHLSNENKDEFVGKYRKGRDYGAHSSIFDLTIRKNGKFSLLISGSSINPDRKVIGKWIEKEGKITLIPNKIITNEFRKEKRKSDHCSELGNGFCSQTEYTYKDGVLISDEKPFFRRVD